VYTTFGDGHPTITYSPHDLKTANYHERHPRESWPGDRLIDDSSFDCDMDISYTAPLCSIMDQQSHWSWWLAHHCRTRKLILWIETIILISKEKLKAHYGSSAVTHFLEDLSLRVCTTALADTIATWLRIRLSKRGWWASTDLKHVKVAR
jgi:hypothetical protein